jgi:hypothetical protein
MDALEPFRVEPLKRASEVPLSAYLREDERESVYDVELSVFLKSMYIWFCLSTLFAHLSK